MRRFQNHLLSIVLFALCDGVSQALKMQFGGIKKRLLSRRDAVFGSASVLALPFAALAEDATATPPSGPYASYQDGPRGLKYKVLKQGSGPKPQRAQEALVTYSMYKNGFPEEGGTLVDTSKKPIIGQLPVTINVGSGQVTKGWDLALMDMREGESRRLVVPPELGFGDIGYMEVPINSTLYYELTMEKLKGMFKLTPAQIQFLEENPL